MGDLKRYSNTSDISCRGNVCDIKFPFCSSLMVSTTNQVYQSLAHLLRWSDQVLLRGNEEVSKESAREVIKCVEDGLLVGLILTNF